MFCSASRAVRWSGRTRLGDYAVTERTLQVCLGGGPGTGANSRIRNRLLFFFPQPIPAGTPSRITFLRSLATLVIALSALCGPHLRAATEGARVLKYSKQDVITIRAKIRFSTLIIPPDDEEILDFTTGDKEHRMYQFYGEPLERHN